MDSYKSPKFILALLLVLAVTAIVIVSVATKNTQPFQNQFSVTAEGKVFAKPDIANIRLGVRTDARPTAAQAIADNTKKMNEVVASVKNLGIEEKDIKTSQYQLYPEYDYPDGRQRLRGYSLNQEVTLKIRDLDKVGAVIENATQAGANQVGDISFTIDDVDDLKAQARAEAIVNAKQKMEELQNRTGIKLDRLINVYESDQPQYPVPYYGIGGMGGDMAMAKSSVPQIEPGQNEIVVNVTMTWEVED